MKIALVTGGSRGIGRAIGCQLAAMGYHVLVNFKSNEAEAIKTLELIRERQGEGELLPFDVADKQQVEQQLGGWIAAHPDTPIEVLVNNAGIREDALMAWMQDEQWDRVLRTNLDSFYYVTRQVLNGMMGQKYGRIISIVSLSGLKGVAGQTNYSAAKAGLIGATKALAQELARQNITVNAVAPGFIQTDMLEGIEEKDIRNLVPARRMGTPEEVAHAVGFLASPEASYITAQVLSVNGGLYS